MTQRPLGITSLKDYFTGILRLVEAALLLGNVHLEQHKILAVEMSSLIGQPGHHGIADARIENAELHLGMLLTQVFVDTGKNSIPIFQHK